MSVGADWNQATAGYVDLEKNSLDIWALVRRRKWLILFMLAAGLALGYLYYEKATRIYETQAQVLVTERRTVSESPLGNVANEPGYGRLTNHIQLIRSPVVVQRAVEKFRLNELTSFQGMQPQNVAAKIISDLESIRAGGREAVDTDIMLISYRSTNYVDAMTVLKAIIRSYQDFLGEAYQSANDDFVRLMTLARDDLDTELKKKNAELRRFSKEAPEGLPDIGVTSTAALDRDKIKAERQTLNEQRAKIRATIKTIEAAQQEGRPIDSLILAIEDYRKSDGGQAAKQVQSFTDILFPLYLELQQLTAQFGPQHPKVKEMELKLELVQRHIDDQRLADVNLRSNQAKTPEQFIATVLETLKIDSLKLDNQDIELASQQDKAAKEAQYLQDFQTQRKVLDSEIKRTEELYQSVVERLTKINLMKDAGGITTKTVAPPDGAAQVEPNIWKVLSVSGFVGLALGMGLAYLVDLADKSFRNPEEVRHELGVPILGHLPVIVTESRRRKKDAPQSPIGDIVCTFHRPKSTYSEAYRAVRTALNFGIRGEGHKVIQVTSPDPGDGKSTLSANLAVCMAQSGRRVLLVDADFRRPRVHRLFGAEPGVGLSAVIKGTADLPEAIVPTDVDNLFLLPCGPRPSNPSELLSSTRFSELVHVLREQYDIVIIDTPPVLAVTDPCVVAPRVDGVVLLIRITKHVRPHAKRALESLESLGANLIGIVVNGVGGNRPGMGYGFGSQYGYRYATNSGYYDSYSYNYGGYHHYYDDAETPTEEQVLRGEGYVKSQPQDEQT